MLRLTMGVLLAAMAAMAGSAGAQPGGADLYAQKCVACHQAGGIGAPGLAPPLAGNAGRFAQSPEGREYLARVVLNGLAGAITVDGVRYAGAMPAQGTMSDEEVARVLGYVLKEIEQVGDLGWLTPAYIAEVRRAGGSPGDSFKLRGKVPGAAK